MKINWRRFGRAWRNTFLGVGIGIGIGRWIQADETRRFWSDLFVWGLAGFIAVVPEMIFQVVRGIRRYRSVAYRKSRP